MPAIARTYTLETTHIEADLWGWKLTRGGAHVALHTNFHPDFDRDVEAAMDWADDLIGRRHDWHHTRAHGFDRWVTAGEGC